MFSANLGFLWTELPLPDAIRAARAAGFVAVECHWPYATPSHEVKAALDETGLPMLSLNTVPGHVGEFGLSALPGREEEARAAVDLALTYAVATDTKAIHVMAGTADGPEAHACFVDTLRYACHRAAALGKTILIEPLNPHDAPGYFLNSTAQAVAILEEVGHANLRLMFDCYHVQLIEGDLTNQITRLMPYIGHIQFAGVPGRGRPDQGEVNYAHVFEHIRALVYSAPLGAEYRPGGQTEKTLGWMQALK